MELELTLSCQAWLTRAKGRGIKRWQSKFQLRTRGNEVSIGCAQEGMWTQQMWGSSKRPRQDRGWGFIYPELGPSTVVEGNRDLGTANV